MTSEQKEKRKTLLGYVSSETWRRTFGEHERFPNTDRDFRDAIRVHQEVGRLLDCDVLDAERVRDALVGIIQQAKALDPMWTLRQKVLALAGERGRYLQVKAMIQDSVTVEHVTALAGKISSDECADLLLDAQLTIPDFNFMNEIRRQIHRQKNEIDRGVPVFGPRLALALAKAWRFVGDDYVPGDWFVDPRTHRLIEFVAFVSDVAFCPGAGALKDYQEEVFNDLETGLKEGFPYLDYLLVLPELIASLDKAFYAPGKAFLSELVVRLNALGAQMYAYCLDAKCLVHLSSYRGVPPTAEVSQFVQQVTDAPLGGRVFRALGDVYSVAPNAALLGVLQKAMAQTSDDRQRDELLLCQLQGHLAEGRVDLSRLLVREFMFPDMALRALNAIAAFNKPKKEKKPAVKVRRAST